MLETVLSHLKTSVFIKILYYFCQSSRMFCSSWRGSTSCRIFEIRTQFARAIKLFRTTLTARACDKIYFFRFPSVRKCEALHCSTGMGEKLFLILREISASIYNFTRKLPKLLRQCLREISRCNKQV